MTPIDDIPILTFSHQIAQLEDRITELEAENARLCEAYKELWSALGDLHRPTVDELVAMLREGIKP